ncbi:MAG: DUF1553 domain-containing protein, partial [Armatimonadaceae bacterium]
TADADRFDDAPKVVAPTKAEIARREQTRKEWEAAVVSVESEPGWLEWQGEARAKHPWVPLRLSGSVARSGATLSARSDHAVLVGGTAALLDSTVVEFPNPVDLPTGFQLEVLRDGSLPGGGPGRRADDSNAVVSEFRVEWISDQGATERVRLGRPRADHSQVAWDVSAAVDGKPETGWAWAPHNARPHRAWFAIEEPKLRPGGRWRVTIEQNLSGFVLGCFRVSVAAGAGWESAELTPEDPAAPLWVPKEQRTWEQRSDIAELFAQQRHPELFAALRTASRQKRSAEVRPVETPVLEELPESRRRVTRVHQRGDFLSPGDVVEATLLPGFGAAPGGRPNRLTLADWLVSPGNPLTARVAVNRIWARLFGRG